jgi:hypothetical protein
MQDLVFTYTLLCSTLALWTPRVTAGVTVAGTRRVTLKDAAQMLGISKEAVRKRVSRGTLPSDVGEDGKRYVYLDAGGDVGGDGEDGVGSGASPGHDALIAQLRDEVAAWREEARRKDTIIMQMAQANATLAARVPELEAPREARDGDLTASEERGKAEEASPEQEPRRSWLYRFFFGP